MNGEPLDYYEQNVRENEKADILNLLYERIATAGTMDSRNEVGRLVVDVLQDIANKIKANEHRGQGG